MPLSVKPRFLVKATSVSNCSNSISLHARSIDPHFTEPDASLWQIPKGRKTSYKIFDRRSGGFAKRTFQSLQAFSIVAANRASRSTAERPARPYAPDPENGSHELRNARRNSKSWGSWRDLKQPEAFSICNLQIIGSQSSQDSRGCRSTLHHLAPRRYRRNGESHITRLPLNTTVSLPDLNEVFPLPKACEALNANSFTA
jgi:hypothetical protein